MNLSVLPNILSGLRIALVVPIGYALLDGQFEFALLLYFISGWTDFLDGYLARRFSWESRLGAILDPIGDKAFLVSGFIILGWLELLPMWLVVTVLVRDAVIVTGAFVYRLVVGPIEIAPLFVSRANTLFQLGVVFFTVLGQILDLPSWFLNVFIYTAFVTTVTSGLAYILVWGRKALLASTKLKSP